jgi:hypothetical protein
VSTKWLSTPRYVVSRSAFDSTTVPLTTFPDEFIHSATRSSSNPSSPYLRVPSTLLAAKILASSSNKSFFHTVSSICKRSASKSPSSSVTSVKDAIEDESLSPWNVQVSVAILLCLYGFDMFSLSLTCSDGYHTYNAHFRRSQPTYTSVRRMSSMTTPLTCPCLGI